jgi:hypothetical protein
MISREGFGGLIKNSTPPSQNNQTSRGSSLVIGRVADVIMDENHPEFKNLGEYSSIGTIIYENVGGDNTGIATKIAKPLFSNQKLYPFIGELVLITSSPSPIQPSTNFTPSQYYISGINLWNSPHHNALPNPRKGDDIFNSPSSTSQSTFIEKDNIHPLLSFTGDVIYEGRNGQSIRFGSTSKSNSELKNKWSSIGDEGNPITILRNGQSPLIKSEGWVPTVENVNEDLSTIYLTSTQKIEFDRNTIDRFTPFHSLGRAKTLNNFFEPQIILNSDRIIINSKKDSILIGSSKGITLSTEEFINVKSQNLFIDAKNVLLGDENASESLVLGDTFMKDFNLLLTALNSLCSVLELEVSWPGGISAPNTPVNIAASSLKTQIEDIKSKIQTSKFTSKTSKTI